jgi:type I restriction enzyme S subunit
MSWDSRKTKDVCDVIMGQSPPSSTYNENGEGLPFFQGKFEFTEIYPEIKKWCSKPHKIAEKGDILMSVRAPVGPVNRNKVKSCVGRGLCAIRAKNLNNLFLFYQLRLLEKRISSYGVGSTFQAINRKQIEEFDLINPPIELQNNFASIVERVETLRNRQKQSTQEITKLFNSLMSKAFQGEMVHDMPETEQPQQTLTKSPTLNNYVES